MFGELEDEHFGGPHEDVSGSPSGVRCMDRNTNMNFEDGEGFDTAYVTGFVSEDGPNLGIVAEGGESAQAEMYIALTPDQCREVAQTLLNMAADAEDSPEVET